MTEHQINLLKIIFRAAFERFGKVMSKDTIELLECLKTRFPEIPGEFIQQMILDWDFEYNRNEKGVINETK